MINGHTFFCPVTTLFQHNKNSFWGVDASARPCAALPALATAARLVLLPPAHAEVITILPEKKSIQKPLQALMIDHILESVHGPVIKK